MASSPESRYVNFPLVLLSTTYADVKAGLSMIAFHALATYARKCRRTPLDALVQLAYHLLRSPNDDLPRAVRKIAERPVVASVLTSLEDQFASREGFVESAKTFLDGCRLGLSPADDEALVDWLALRDAGNFYRWRTNGYDCIVDTAQRAKKIVSAHEYRHGKDASASLPSDYILAVLNSNPALEDMRLLRMVAAVRSLVGSKRFTGTTKDMLRARMLGGKSPAVVRDLVAKNPALRAEHEAMRSRYRFDRIIDDGAVRGFYQKVGAGRRIYLSTEAKNPAELHRMIQKKPALRKAYRLREREARTLAAT